MWDSIEIKGGADATHAASFAKTIIKNETKYREVEAQSGVPWFFIGALHMRESSCNFAGVLHNGEKIIGTRKKTKLVPAGRGPFATWQAAAVDALALKNLSGISWCPSRMAFESERFNGLGYTGKGVNSPYVWAGSNHEQTGKYVADHVWDKSFDDPQIGTMTVIKALCDMRPDIDAAMHENHVSPMQTKTKVQIGGGILAGTTSAAAGGASYFDQIQSFLDIFSQYGTTIATTLTVAAVVGCVGWYFYDKYQAAHAVG
jgi:lysozyme family protein